MVFLLQLACVGKFVKTNGFGNEAVDDRPAPHGLALEFENVKNFGLGQIAEHPLEARVRPQSLLHVPAAN